MLTPQQIKEIEEKFDDFELSGKFDYAHTMNDNIKSFIITTINNILAERDKEIVEMIKNIEMPVYQAEGREHANEGFTKAMEIITGELNIK